MPQLRRSLRLWILSLALLLVAAGLWLGYVGALGAYAAPGLSWWVFGIGFFIAERFAVLAGSRRGAPAITMAAAPFVFGLFHASAFDLLLGYGVGVSAAAVTRRPLAIVQTVFGIARFALFAEIGMTVFRATASGSSAPDWRSWLSAGAATAVLVLRRLISEGAVSRPSVLEAWNDTWRNIGYALIGALTSACLGLLAAMLVPGNPAALLLVGVVALAVLLTHRAFVHERYDRVAAEFLIGAGNALSGRELETAIIQLLTRARSTFNAEIAQLTIFPTQPNEKAFRTTVREGHADEMMVAIDLAGLDDVLEAETDGVIVSRTRSSDATAQMLELRGVNDAMAALLRGESRMLGSLLIGGHLDARAYDARDLRLFRTLVIQTSGILENGRLERSVTRLTQMQEQLTHQAFHDSLTDLANRSLFGEQIEQALQRSAAGGRLIAIIFLDIDDFKGVNDTLGHAAGDALLIEVASRLKSCLRGPDTAARLGGDEFAILIENVEGAPEAEQVARRVLETLRRPFEVAGHTVTVRASLGVAFADSSGDNASNLMRRADVAMYAAKGSGKDRHILFAPGMEADVVGRHKLRGELEQGLAEEQFVLHYQPVVDLFTGDVTGIEALVRWRHPTRGLVAPGAFIHLAEETGLILPLGEFVLRSACATALRLQKRFPKTRQLVVGVNVSAIQLQTPTFVNDVLSTVRESGLAPETLVLELTETMLLEDTAQAITKLEALRAEGIRIAIDDFGTGYSSLSYLRRLPVDILKIAKPFVDDLASGTGEDFARAIVAIAGALRLLLIAEGIEAVSQLIRLRELGCPLGQGYHLCHPVPADEVENLLRRGGVDPARLQAEESGFEQVIPLRRLR